MLAVLRPAFQKNGSVTAGNASGINDGASALVMASAHQIASSEAAPLAQIGGYAHAGVDPEIMGIGPVPAVRVLLARSGLRMADFYVVESNESFAWQALAVNWVWTPPRGTLTASRLLWAIRWGHGRAFGDQGAFPFAAHWQALWLDHHVHRRRSGNCFCHREGVTGGQWARKGMGHEL